jgi:vancomycin permeability regulator SanA
VEKTFSLKKNNHIGASFLFITVVLLITSCTYLRPKPDVLYKRALKKQPYDAIIVPGVPFNGTRWDTTMKGRVLWATYLYRKGYAKNIIFSGGAVYSPYYESKIMALYGAALGIPEKNIFVDTIAEHSTENVYYSYQVAQKHGFKKIALATDPFQSANLMGFTKRRFKPRIDHIPFVEDSLKVLKDLDPKINPESAKVKDFKSILETQSKFYRFKGTLGKNIRFKKK